MNKPRVIRWVALFGGFFLVSLFALALLLPMIVDSEAVKSKARAFVAEKTNGLARVEKIDLFWFPRPGVVIRDAAISFDKEIHGNVQQLRLYPSMRRLLTGNLAFSSITADGAKWIVRLTFDYLNHTGDFNVAFPDLNNEAFPYQFISAKGTVERQSIFAKELIIEASPYTITAQGKADLEQRTIDAKGLVSVLLPADKFIKSIPLVGSILSGSMVGIPVEVTGALEQPRVSYLSPAALGAEIVNIPVRLLKVPLEGLQIFTPGEPAAEKK